MALDDQTRPGFFIPLADYSTNDIKIHQSVPYTQYTDTTDIFKQFFSFWSLSRPPVKLENLLIGKFVNTSRVFHPLFT